MLAIFPGKSFHQQEFVSHSLLLAGELFPVIPKTLLEEREEDESLFDSFSSSISSSVLGSPGNRLKEEKTNEPNERLH